jgi:hypothetical protein
MLIAAIWVLVIWGAIAGASSPLPSEFPRQMTRAAMVTILVMPVLFFGVMSFWMPHSPFYHSTIARLVDARFGENAFSTFLVRLKPLLAFAVALAIQGARGLWTAKTGGESPGAYTIYGFFLSGSIGFAFAHAILYYRKAMGVYPSPPAVPGSPHQPLRLRDALRAYWWTLIGLAVFPAALVFGDRYGVPFEYFALPFFAAGLLAGWPYLSGRAPFSFWIVAGGVWLAAGIAAALIAYVVGALVPGV